MRTLLFFVLALLFVAQPTQAYFTTNQEAMALPGSHTALFLIDYSFGMTKHEVVLPVSARMGTETKDDSVSFSVLDEAGNAVDGKVTSMVLSNAPLSDEGMYVTQKGLGRKFRLAAFFTPTTYDASKKYRLQVTHLPFNFDGAQQLGLNPSELKYYTTPLISL